MRYQRRRTVGAERPHVVIVGGGFGGLYAARGLSRAEVDVTVIDRRNFHLFQPMLYQVATAALAVPDIARPIRKILRRQANATVYLANATAVDAANRRLVLDDGAMDYDFLVLAPGAVDTYFGNDAWVDHAPGLKTIGDALEIRRRILSAFEEAERESDPELRRACLTFAVVGGGPTGVEMAGALAEIARHTLARDFRNFDPRDARVVLIEGQARILPTYPTALSVKAKAMLEQFGVAVWTGAKVTAIGERGVTLGGDALAARTVVWAAGVRAHPLVATVGAPTDRAGRVLVAPDLTVPGRAEVYVIGDAAAVALDGGWVPGVAPAAMQMGRAAAENIMRQLRGEPRRPFRYVDKGSLATIGRKAAVADFGRFRLAGTFAWMMWLLVHIFFLIGFRNRFVVLFEWAWAYVTYQRSARVIITDRRAARGAGSAP